jgi:hydroxypyruvate isomerase
MNRRKFTQTLAGSFAGGTFARSSSLLNPNSPANAPVATTNEISQIPFRLSVMLWTVFTDLPFEKRLEKVAEAGYQNVELVGEYKKWTPAEFQRANAKRKELGITFDCTAGLKHGVSNPAEREALLAELRQELPIMEQLECPALILLSGNRIAGMPREVQHQTCIETLKAAAAAVEGKSINGESLRLLVETIDPQENPQYYLTGVTEALEIVQAVGHPQVQLLYDFYHEQIAAGNLIEKLEKSVKNLGLVHIADVPGRHEPGTGEINYANIFRKLTEIGYTRVAAMEFHPSGDPVMQLRAARNLALQAGADGRTSKQ